MENLQGQKLGKLTIIESVKGKENRPSWRCKCDCGVEKIILNWSLIRKKKPTRSCGCSHQDSINNLVGKKFGKLTVISLYTKKVGDKKSNGAYWICKCDCGNEIIRKGCRILYREAKGINSCGCLRKQIGENNKFFEGYKEISGTYYSRTVKGAIIRSKTFDPKITIQYLWELFIKQNRKCALTKQPIQFQTRTRVRDGTASLDRIDNTKGYEIGNIQWIHKDVNWMKHDFDQSYYIKICKMVAENNA